MKWWKAQDSPGQSTVEFGLMFVAFMFILAGIFDFSRAIFYYNSLAEAARAGVRYAIVHGENATPISGPCSGSVASCACNDTDVPSGSAIRAAVETRATGMDRSSTALVVTCSWPDTNVLGTYLNSRNKRVKVTATYIYQPILTSFIPGANLTLTGEATSFIQY